MCNVAVKVILWLQDWACPPCRGLCNCSICRTREGKKPTGILVPFVKSEGYNSVKEYLQFEEDWQTDTVLTDTSLRVTSESQSHWISLYWIVPTLPYIIECQSLFCITFGFLMERTLYKAMENILFMAEANHSLRVFAEIWHCIPDVHVW